MAVKGLYALQNGFMGFEKTGLFFGERSAERVRIPITCYLVRTGDTTILFDTGLSPRAVPGLLRTDPMAVFTEAGLLLFPDWELAVQQDEYAYANYPAGFFAGFYYRKNFDLPGYRWRLLDGDAEIVPGVTALRSDGHTPGHQSLLVELPQTGPVILAGDCCYWQESIDKEIPPGVVWGPTRAMPSLQRLKTGAPPPSRPSRRPRRRRPPTGCGARPSSTSTATSARWRST